MSIEQNKAIVRRVIDEGVNQGNIAVVDELFAPDFVNHNPPPGGRNDREGIRQELTATRQMLPDVHISIEELIAEGDLAVVRAVIRGTHEGPLMGVPATGKPVVIGSISILRIRDGQVVERWNQTDALGLLQQIGALQ